MPTYEYYCLKCAQHFELFQSMSDQALAVCPQNLCRLKKWGKGKVKRMIGAGAGFIFKGSGFYITDYRSENYKQAAKSESSPSTGSGEAKPGKTDGAPSKTHEPAAGKKDSKPSSASKKKD
jgi:putative FmdB family regulatory protein